MKKQLLFLTLAIVFLVFPSRGQSVGPNPGNISQVAACDLNLQPLLPSFNSQCTVAFTDLTIPVITDSCGNSVVPTTDNSIFPITATGTTTIVWEYVNELGGIETSNQNINILDFTEPVPDVAILPNFYSQCAVQLADLPAPTATDNCSGVTVANDGIFPITVSTLITWTYTDANGNQSYQTQDIYINDFTDPVPDVAVLSNINALCQVQEADIPVPTATDNCGGFVTVTNDVVFPIINTTLITWTYTDANGNSSYQTQDVYINDFTDPIPDAAVLPDVHALCQVEATDLIAPTATDNCSVGSITSDAVFPIVATTQLTWTFTDPSGNSTFQTQEVIIDDNTNPVPDAIALADVISQCALSPTDLIAPTATDNCTAVVAVTNDGIFPVTGSTTITWTYTDNNGNSISQVQNIVIDDTTAPTPDAAVLADVLVQCELLEADVIEPTATDNCSGVVFVTNDATFPITTATTITWTYADADGNTASQTQNVIVNDTTAPTPDAAFLTDVTAECEVLETDVAVPTATDNCAATVTVTNDAVFPITMSTTITWTYTDIDGNSSTQTQDVIIDDVTKPVPDVVSLPDFVTACAALEADVAAPTATDNCTGLVTATSDAVFPINASTTITWTYTDASGNSETQTQNIVINDNVAPTPDAALLADITAQCELLEADVIAPTATDNCVGVVTVTNDGAFPITASATITWTYTDSVGNTSAQTQNVIINDNTAPTPDGVTLSDINAACEVLEVDVLAPTATDNCSGIVTVTNDATFPITASTAITWTYTDANGNSAAQTQNVIINDATAPTPDTALLADITASCEVLETDLTVPTATDNCSGVVTVTSNVTFPITASTTITWTYTDGNGNTVAQTQNVIISDATAPTPDAAILTDIISQCALLQADLISPTATDNCSVVTVTSDAIFPITLSTMITWTYTDANGNATSQTQNIIVNDTTAPTPDAVTLADVIAQCQLIEADLIAPTATDNCSAVTVTNDGTFPITASITITWTYTDGNGNIASQVQNVIVDDTTAPTPDSLTLANILAQCEVLEVDVVAPTATDNCSTVTVTNDATFPITSSTMITWTYSDADGNSASQTQNVIVNDTTAPTPDAASLVDVTAVCQILEVDVTFPTATDNCSGFVTVTNDASFPITTSTTITWSYTDANGNTATQTQNAVINDAIAPTPDAIALTDVIATCQILEADLLLPMATDNCSVVTVTNDATFPIAASTTITWTYADANGNSVTQAQNVIITDATAPTPDVAALDDITAQCELLQSDVIPPTATDNCSVVTVTNDGIFPITASTIITWTYTDANGNATSQSQNVIVNDTTAPTPNALTLADVTAQCQVLEADITAPTATDNCSAVTVTNNATFPITSQGVTTITWTYTDANGNSTTQNQDILIGDNTAPTITLSDIAVSVNVGGTVTVTTAQLENGTATDNCGIASISVFPNTFSCTELGNHVVTVTLIDVNGNVTIQTATVTVTDPSNFCDALGVIQNEKAAFALYPNPTADNIYVESANNVTVRSISVYSLSGQLIVQQRYKSPAEKYRISLGSLPQGMYLLRLETSEGTYTKKVAKE